MIAKQKTVIIIAGPTAVGKTAVGIAVAKHFGANIISADSRQCFQELQIGVARPTPEELAEVPHHFIATHSIHDRVTAATFEEYALAKAEELFHQQNVIVIVGGTGLYIKAFTEGMDAIPAVPLAIHEQVVAQYKKEGIFWLQDQIRQADPLFYEKGEMLNPQRVMRALEVVRATGQSILSFRTGEKKQRDFSIVKIAINLPREQLYNNINQRVDKMMEQGLLNEVVSLWPYQHLNAMQTVGYKEIFAHLNGELDLSAAVDLVKRNTRHYAKRQLTWFRKYTDYHWLPPDAQQVINTIKLD